MYSADEFIKATGWAFEDGTLPAMQRALSFYFAEVPPSRLDMPVDDPGPWALKINGVTTHLCVLMQAVKFTSPVEVVGLPRGRRLLSYGCAPDSKPGCWFTFPGTPAQSLAIAHDQVWPRNYTITSPVRALCSTVGDNYVDWARTRGVREQYRGGGGRQLFIWNAHARTSLEAPPTMRRRR